MKRYVLVPSGKWYMVKDLLTGSVLAGNYGLGFQPREAQRRMRKLNRLHERGDLWTPEQAAVWAEFKKLI